MDIDIRKSIYANFENTDHKEIKESIESSIASKDEMVLPGLGVFFEILWNNSSANEKDDITSKIKSSL
ncbi:MAG TPA: small acid-soluble spore protein SspI [Tenericutes bacterium]|nr:small acid-soluble spore protein SspI [Mycoplasmatota bacterium]